MLPDEEWRRFVAWIPSQGFAESTARTYAERARFAMLRGASTSADVDRVMPNHPRRSRCFARCGLDLLQKFLEVPA
jgi:hypothetical protein